MQDEPLIHELLASLNSREAEEAWARFLDNYAPVILQTVRLAERESDAVGECFLFVCEGLAKDRFRRLRQFRTAGPARFSTWLRVVARNLCVDWRRKKFGRRYNFEFVSRLPALDHEVFRCLHEEGMPISSGTASCAILTANLPPTTPRVRGQDAARVPPRQR